MPAAAAARRQGRPRCLEPCRGSARRLLVACCCAGNTPELQARRRCSPAARASRARLVQPPSPAPCTPPAGQPLQGSPHRPPRHHRHRHQGRAAAVLQGWVGGWVFACLGPCPPACLPPSQPQCSVVRGAARLEGPSPCSRPSLCDPRAAPPHAPPPRALPPAPHGDQRRHAVQGQADQGVLPPVSAGGRRALVASKQGWAGCPARAVACFSSRGATAATATATVAAACRPAHRHAHH